MCTIPFPAFSLLKLIHGPGSLFEQCVVLCLKPQTADKAIQQVFIFTAPICNTSGFIETMIWLP